MKATINVCRPFYLIFYVGSLGVFYSLSSLRRNQLFSKVKGPLQIGSFARIRSLTVGVLVGLSLILGPVIGTIASIQLSVIVNMHLSRVL